MSKTLLIVIISVPFVIPANAGIQEKHWIPDRTIRE
jgi:hypothetical protein